MIYPINIKDVNDIQNISKVAVEYSDIDMSIKCNNTMIDPKSIIALFNFVGKDAHLVVSDDLDQKLVERLVKRMGVA